MENKLRAEEEVLKDFEKLGYDIIENNDWFIKLNNNGNILRISRCSILYRYYREDSELALPIKIKEHKLLNELYSIWGWL